MSCPLAELSEINALLSQLPLYPSAKDKYYRIMLAGQLSVLSLFCFCFFIFFNNKTKCNKYINVGQYKDVGKEMLAGLNHKQYRYFFGRGII